MNQIVLMLFNGALNLYIIYGCIYLYISAGPIPLRVREAEVPIVSENECVRKINAVTEKIFILPASSFCAGGESGHDACQVSKIGMTLTIYQAEVASINVVETSTDILMYPLA